MKRVLKKKVILFSSLFLCILLLISVVINGNKETNISSILKTEYYSYLPIEAKEYITQVYEETGEVILTEANKEVNKPYLNPDYIEYLELSEKEREKVVLIPDAYILDYSITQSYANYSLPSSFDLRNQNGHNFVSPIKNQGTTSICWAFASVENVETLYMKNNNQSYSELIPKFSIRQMDYITSTDYDSSSSISYLALKGDWSSGMCNSSCRWTSWENPDNGSHELNKGGNFYTSSIAMANGITLTDESVMPWHEENDPVYVNEIYGYDKSLYEVNSTINMPTINADSASQELINSYVSDIKKYMMEYGGPFVGTYSPKSTCGFENIDGKKVLKTDDCVNNSANKDLGHAMQIIGWDDNYTYSYCESGTKHYSTNSDGSCSTGEPATGKGAWIIRNSWGTETDEAQEYSYVYLTYDSTRLSVGFTTSISEMKNRTWDNNYHSNPWIERKISKGMLSVESQTKEFNTHNDKPEKIEKIKFLTSSKNGKYNISVLTKNKNYENIGTITTTEAGIYTVDLSDKNVILEDKIFSVKIEGENAVQFINDSISVFTSNTNKEPLLETHYISGIKTYENPEANPSEENVAFVSSGIDITIKLEHYLKNISDYKKITYKAMLDGIDHSRYFFDDYSNISSNMIYLDGHVTTTLIASKEDYSDVPVCGLEYTFQILYDNEVIESFPLKRICYNWDRKTTDYTKSEISFHKNDGSGYVSTVSKNDTTYLTIMNKDGTGRDYIGSEKNFFLYDRYIKSWNTKPDGTGETYTDNSYLIYKDMDFYAQWSDPKTEEHKYTIVWECNRYICHESEFVTKTSRPTFNKEHIVPINTFTNLTEGQEFIYWAFDDEDLDNIYYEEEKVINLTKYGFDSPYKDEEREYLEAVWSDSYYSVNFDANSGSGTMKGIKIVKDRTSRLKYNLFEKKGYKFTGWNIEADGTGIYYADGQKVSLTEDITLYAQWEKIYNVEFNANGGTGAMDGQMFTYDEFQKINLNKFVKQGYKFTGWNTEADGAGTEYQNEENVKNLTETAGGTVTLYAQWTPITYNIEFNANNAVGDMSNQIYIYDESQQLSTNVFEKYGYIFKEWNTNYDGTGTSYRDKEEVKNLTNVADSVVTLHAQWTPITYNIEFNANGGTGTMDKQVFTFDEFQKISANKFKKDGYYFSGWSTAPDGTGAWYLEQDEVANLTSVNNETIILYAQWANNPTIDYYAYDFEGLYDGEEHTIEMHVYTENHNIKYSINNTDYNLTELPKFKDVGEYTVYYKITADGYEDITGSNKVKIYGVKSFGTELALKDNVIVVKNNSFKNMTDKINTYSLSTEYLHMDKYSDVIGDEMVGTGHKLRININYVNHKEYIISVLGDISGDGLINSADLLKMRQHLIGTNSVFGEFFIAADINNDNAVNSADLLRLRQHLLGTKPIA